MNEEEWNPIDDIKTALKTLEEKGIYYPESDKFTISKEMYNYLMR